MVVDIRNNDFSVVEESRGLAIVDFAAQWCKPCKEMEHVLHTIHKDLNIPVYKVDVEANQKLTSRFMITGLPTLMFVKNGKIMASQTGSASLEHIQTRITELQ